MKNPMSHLLLVVGLISFSQAQAKSGDWVNISEISKSYSGTVNVGSCKIDISPIFSNEAHTIVSGLNVQVTQNGKSFNHSYLINTAFKHDTNLSLYSDDNPNKPLSPAYKENRYSYYQLMETKKSDHFWNQDTHAITTLNIDKKTNKIVSFLYSPNTAVSADKSGRVECGIVDDKSRVAYEKTVSPATVVTSQSNSTNPTSIAK